MIIGEKIENSNLTVWTLNSTFGAKIQIPTFVESLKFLENLVHCELFWGRKEVKFEVA